MPSAVAGIFTNRFGRSIESQSWRAVSTRCASVSRASDGLTSTDT